jgi:hypothetical protein
VIFIQFCCTFLKILGGKGLTCKLKGSAQVYCAVVAYKVMNKFQVSSRCPSCDGRSPPRRVVVSSSASSVFELLCRHGFGNLTKEAPIDTSLYTRFMFLPTTHVIPLTTKIIPLPNKEVYH